MSHGYSAFHNRYSGARRTLLYQAGKSHAPPIHVGSRTPAERALRALYSWYGNHGLKRARARKDKVQKKRDKDPSDQSVSAEAEVGRWLEHRETYWRRAKRLIEFSDEKGKKCVILKLRGRPVRSFNKRRIRRLFDLLSNLEAKQLACDLKRKPL